MAILPKSSATVSVAYAASLIAPMQGPLADALRKRTGLVFAGEPKGSRALANLIRAGLRTPDVFISADPKLIDRSLATGDVVFASARMVVAYSRRSPNAKLFDAAASGKRSLLSVLLRPDMRLGRTDPALDPKGARTLHVFDLLSKKYGNASIARRLLASSQTFPEEDLTVRVSAGELDAGFFYSVETARPELRTIELPAGTNLSGEILFAVAALSHAPHPQAAHRFVSFLLSTEARKILERYGLHYLAHPRYNTWMSG